MRLEEQGGGLIFMSDAVWSPGDRFKYLDKDGEWAYGVVTSTDIDRDLVFATLDGYPSGVRGCFHSQSPHIHKIEFKRRKRK